MTILCTIDLLTREVFLPADQRIAAYDHNVDVIRFQAEPIEDFSLNTSTIKIAAKGPNKARHDYPVDPSTVSIEEETGYITFDWPIPQGVTEMPEDMFGYGSTGQLIFAVCAEIISGSTVSKAWHSDDGIITVVAHLEPEAGGGEDPSETATNAQKIGQLQTDVAVINTQIGALGNGSPTPVATVAEMTDESAVYLYTGSETGYNTGNWYYYNGTAWISGGTYGGAVTSTTFNQPGVPADDFAVGQALADKADADDVTAVQTALAEKADTADVESLESAVGTLGNLSTEVKTDIVSAINEVAESSRKVAVSLPELYLNGATSDMTAEKNEVGLQYTYVDNNKDSHRTGWLKAKWQGDSSVIFAERYGKANYTLKFYHDALFKRKDKIKYAFDNKQSKWVAKANWIDAGHARNIVSSRLWADIVKSRHTAVPALLADSPCYGAINGYPIKIYENQIYHGLYTMNIPKDDFTFGMDEDNPLHCVIGFKYQAGICRFECGPTGTPLTEGFTESAFLETEVGVVSADIANGFNAMARFVANSTDADFKASLNDYLDVESIIDYYIFMYFICSIDSLAKNIHLLTYDGGTKWYITAYDLDETFGNVQGGAFKPTDTRCPEDYQCKDSILWSRLESNFGEEIYQRYQELRASVLSLAYVNDTIDFFTNMIPAEEYTADRTLYTSLGNRGINHGQQMKDFIAERSVYVDAEIAGLIPPVPATAITLNRSSYTFENTNPIVLVATLTPADSTDTVTWSSSDTNVATVTSSGVVTPVSDGVCTITATAVNGNVSATCSLTVPEDLYADGIRVNLDLNHGAWGTNKASDTWYDSSDYVEIPDDVSVLETASAVREAFAVSFYDANQNIVTADAAPNYYPRYAIHSDSIKYFVARQKANSQIEKIFVTKHNVEDYELSYTWLNDGATHNVDATDSVSDFYSSDYIAVPDDETLSGFYVMGNTARRFGIAFYDANHAPLAGKWLWSNSTSNVCIGLHGQSINQRSLIGATGYNVNNTVAEIEGTVKYIKIFDIAQDNLELYWI